MSRCRQRVGALLRGLLLRRVRRRDEGMVTAEVAVALPVLVVVLAIAVGAVAAVTAQLRCVDAAREAARAAARGEPPETVRQIGSDAGPSGATVVVSAGSDRVVVTVSADVDIAGGLLPAITVTATAVAVPEPTGDDGPLAVVGQLIRAGPT